MNTKPLNLTITDFTETRSYGSHCYFPVDEDTTRRLNKILAQQVSDQEVGLRLFVVRVSQFLKRAIRW